MVFNNYQKNTLLKKCRQSLREDMKEMNYCIDKLNQVNREINDMLHEQIISKENTANKKKRNKFVSRNMIY